MSISWIPGVLAGAIVKGRSGKILGLELSSARYSSGTKGKMMTFGV